MTVGLRGSALTEAAAPGRDCGGCTACCTVLAVDELRKPMRYACPHQAADGCRIYADRPHGCRQFHCVWLRGGLPAEEDWRPDRLGLLFDQFVRATDGQPQLTAFEVIPGALSTAAAKQLLRQIVDVGGQELMLFYRDGSVARLVPDGPATNADSAGPLPTVH
uniref:YkgJ family cysteine cluster protein n=1 Tax=Schlesneria paludicola TaxID=360056 RepID=A0A7C2JZ42_9PLAN